MDRIVTFKKFAEQRPDDPFPLYSLAMEYRNQENFEEAQSYFDQLRERFPDYLAAYLHAGANLTALGRKDDAVECYKKGLELAGKAGDGKAREELQQALAQLEGTS